MTKHDRSMKALNEIKLICSKHDCDDKCPFIMGNKDDIYRDCEVMKFINPHMTDAPNEWGEYDDER